MPFFLVLVIFALVVMNSRETAAVIEQAARVRGVPLTSIDLAHRGLRSRYGADLVVVRPDRYIAWRGHQLPGSPLALIDLVTGNLAGGQEGAP